LPNDTHITPPQGQGRGTLKVLNGNPSDAAVKLVDRTSGQTLRFVYVRANQQVTMRGIPPCTCILKYSTGSNWNQNDRRFTQNTAFYQFQPLLYFREQRPMIYTATLYRRPDGNARTSAISERNF